MPHEFFRRSTPGVEKDALTGQLVVIEGPDTSGRSTHVGMLSAWLESKGHAVVQTGLKRSRLVGGALEQAKEGNVLGPRTLSLFYATDFYDQLENRIYPALKAGFIVLADRYVYTLMARDIVRGANADWVRNLYSGVVVPDVVFRLDVSPQTLASRMLDKSGQLDYWESGADLGISRDRYQGFLTYQGRMADVFRRFDQEYGLVRVDGERDVEAMQLDLRARVRAALGL